MDQECRGGGLEVGGRGVPSGRTCGSGTGGAQSVPEVRGEEALREVEVGDSRVTGVGSWDEFDWIPGASCLGCRVFGETEGVEGEARGQGQEVSAGPGESGPR